MLICSACLSKLAKDGVDTRALQAYLGHRNARRDKPLK